MIKDFSLTPLTDRALLLLKGADAAVFLNGLITQNVPDEEGLLRYGAHLSTKGRIVCDFLIFRTSEGIVLDCPLSLMMHLAKALHQFQVHEDIEFHNLSDSMAAYALWGPKAGSIYIPKNTLRMKDPRLSAMGYRLYAPLKNTLKPNARLESYHAQRIIHTLPQADTDRDGERTLANEWRMEYLNGIDFQKGCYVGQEMTARTKYRTQPKTLLYKVHAEDLLGSAQTVQNSEGDPVGLLLSRRQNMGIALLKSQAVEAGTLFLDSVPLKAYAPEWAIA